MENSWFVVFMSHRYGFIPRWRPYQGGFWERRAGTRLQPKPQAPEFSSPINIPGFHWMSRWNVSLSNERSSQLQMEVAKRNLGVWFSVGRSEIQGSGSRVYGGGFWV